jgi:hypothetical protein
VDNALPAILLAAEVVSRPKNSDTEVSSRVPHRHENRLSRLYSAASGLAVCGMAPIAKMKSVPARGLQNMATTDAPKRSFSELREHCGMPTESPRTTAGPGILQAPSTRFALTPPVPASREVGPKCSVKRPRD